jgi:hypothetical protein
MAYMRARSHRRAPIQMLVFGLVLLGANAYLIGGQTAAEFAVVHSLEKLAIQVPAGIIAVLIASRLIDFDFGTVGTVAIKIAAITILAEGVAVWVGYVAPFSFFVLMAGLTVMVVGFFWLFELSKWETYLIVLLNIAVLFGANYLVAKYMQSAPSSTPKAAVKAKVHRR